MTDKTDEEQKKKSLKNFIEPDEVFIPDGDEAAVFMKQRKRQHRRFLKTARGAQKIIERLHQQETTSNTMRQTSTPKTESD
ncbi:MAG: hypothetical protein CMM58_13975 [Rhodospirillaceae bacterium]|nr:hypothetical protein [Rhodospirillaceae bacterium]|tara:strand:+ start:208 stop:450 length:243 start_codon:yes stop_codon:yes gene_type:complete